MRVLRRTAPPAAAGLLLVLVAGPAVAGGGVQPDPSGLSVRQSVLTELSPTGVVDTSRVFTQVASDGAGPVTLPAQSTAALRGLSGFSRPSVDGDDVTWEFDEPGSRRSMADNVAGVPVTFAISYTLDGRAITPDDLVGRDGELTVTYTVRNVSGVATDVDYRDGRGNPRTATVDVPIPLVGSMSTVLDSRFGEVAAPGAAVVGDGRGNTVVNWSLVLFAPLGLEEQTVTYSAQVRDAVVPPVSSQIIPVTSRSFGSMASASEAYAGAATSTTELTGGAGEIDANLRKLADGAGELMTGLGALAAGAGRLSTGLGEAESGSSRLAAGVGTAADGGAELASGLGALGSGAGQLSDGLGRAYAGGSELDAGLAQLATGAGELSAGLGQARDGASELAVGLAALDAGAAKLGAGAGVLAAGAQELDDRTGELVAGTGLLADGAGKLVDGLGDFKDAVNAPDGLPAAEQGAAQLGDGVSSVISGIGTMATAGTLLNGLARISGGLSNPLCDLAAPEDPANPCGVRQVLHLLQLGTDNPAAFASGPGQNPTCAADPALHPCGLDQGLARVEGGLGLARTGAADLEQGAADLGDGLGGGFRAGLGSIQTNATALAGASASVDGYLDVVLAEAGALTVDAQAALGAADATNAAIGSGLAGLATGAGELIAGLGTPLAAGVDPATVCGPAVTTYETLVAASSPIPVLLALKVMECGSAALEDGIGVAGATGTLLDGTSQLRTGVAEVARALVALQGALGDTATADTLVNGVARVMTGLDNPAAFAAGTGQNLTCATATLANGLRPCGAKQGLQLVSGGLAQLEDGLSDAVSAINAGLGSLTVPGETLLYGAGSLLAGAGELSSGAGRLRAEGTRPLSAGAAELAAGAGQLADGAAAAAVGGQQLGDGLVRLDDGGRALAAGATKAVDGTTALVNGLAQLDDGGRDLAAGAERAAVGAGELSDGLGQLDDGAGQLAAGLGDAADGSGFLADGLARAADGGDRLADGSQLLIHEGTRVLTAAVNDAAADTGLTVAHLAAVDARGATEGLPYGVPEGASASAVYAFEIAGVAAPKGLSEPGRAATAAGVFGLTGAVGMLGRRRFGLI